jgi:predicted HAD superfamily phosphohydrolase
MSLASSHLSDLTPVLEAWQRGDIKEAELLVKEKEAAGGEGERNNFHWIVNKTDISQVIDTSRRLRRLVREKAGELG